MALQVLREEVRLKNFDYDYPDPSAFYRCQWKWPLWIQHLIRVGIACGVAYGYTLEVVHYYLTAVNHGDEPANGTHPVLQPWDTRRPWYVFFTMWSYTVVLLHLALTAGFSVYITGSKVRSLKPYAYSSSKQGLVTWTNTAPKPLAWYFKLSWLLSDLSIVTAPLVTLMFVCFIHHGGPVDIYNTNVHLLNTVFVLVDQLECARPVRLAHTTAPALFGIIYSVFNYVFWTTDHVQHLLYPGLTDWNHPVQTMTYVAILTVVINPLLMTFWFLVYRLKLYIHAKLYGL